MAETFILPFEKISKKDVGLAGGKGASLGEMTQAGIPVPPGFVVLSGSFDYFIEKSQINDPINGFLKKVDTEDTKSVEKASDEIRKLILSCEMPVEIEEKIKESFSKLGAEYVAVRSSATAEDSSSAAWAGQLESYLNTTEESLIENVRRCWASLFTPRAVFYRFEKKLEKSKISVAVVVQKMVNSKESGIAFTVHPVTEDRNQILIEACFGLGEMIVSGQITPDSYVVDKNMKIVEKQDSYKKKEMIRNNQGKNEIRGLDEEEGSKTVLNDKEIVELAKIILNIEKHYGFPCDIEWAREDKKFYIVQSRPITTLSIQGESAISKKKDPQQIVFNKNWFYAGQWKAPILFNSLWLPIANTKTYKEDESLNSLGGDNFFIDGHYFLLKEDVEKTEAAALKGFEKRTKWFDYVFQTSEKRILELEKAKTIEQMFDAAKEVFACSLLIKHSDGALHPLLEKRCKQLSFSYNKFISLVKPFKETGLSRYKAELVKIEDEKKLGGLLKKYSWLFAPILNDSTLTQEKLVEDWIEIKNQKEDENSTKIPGELKEILELSNKLAYYRTMLFEIFSKKSYEFLDEFKKLSKEMRMDYPKFINLTFYEVLDYIRSKKIPEIGNRTEEDGVAFFSGEYFILDKKIYLADIFERYVQKESQNVISGAVAYPGKIKGKAKLVFSIKDLGKIEKGDIMIAPETMPDFLPGMKKASALVTNQGGITSHAAIVARELKKPCIIGTKVATHLLKDGDLVEVDGNHGFVRILKKANNLGC